MTIEKLKDTPFLLPLKTKRLDSSNSPELSDRLQSNPKTCSKCSRQPLISCNGCTTNQRWLDPPAHPSGETFDGASQRLLLDLYCLGWVSPGIGRRPWHCWRKAKGECGCERWGVVLWGRGVAVEGWDWGWT